MNHLKSGREMNHFVYPPVLLQKEEASLFSDGLTEIVPEQIEELMEVMDGLSGERDFRLAEFEKHLRKKTVNDFTKYLVTLFIEIEFSEAEVVRKWLAYWLRVYELVSEKPPIYLDQILSDKYPRWEIDRALERPIEQFYSGKLRALGSVLLGLCPFHEEKTPSFLIYTNDNHFHCFGTCGAHGDVIEFVMKLRGLTFSEAMRFLI